MRPIGPLVVALVLGFGLFWGNSARADLDPSQIETRASQVSPLVFHYPRQYEPAIDQLDDSSDDVVEGLSRELGIDSFPEVDVWVLPEVNDYFKLKGVEDRAPKWAIGLSLGDRQTVIVARDTELPGGAQTDLEKTFIHELAHVAIDIGRGEGEVPRWFNEGFALTHAREWSPERSEKLTQAAATGALVPLSELDRGFPSHRNVASLAYSQSFHFVDYVKERYGATVTAEIMRGVRAGESFEGALEGATGSSLAALENEWKEGLKTSGSWLAIFRDDFTIFFGVAVLFVIAWLVRRRRLRDSEIEAEDDGEWSYDESRYPLPGERKES